LHTKRISNLVALLHLGSVTDSLRVWINGVQTQAVDLIGGDSVVDISGYLSAAESVNTLWVETASTLYNRVRAYKDTIYTMGVTASIANDVYYTANGPKACGLFGNVTVEWAQVVCVQ
jgi:hypothetical protein